MGKNDRQHSTEDSPRSRRGIVLKISALSVSYVDMWIRLVYWVFERSIKKGQRREEVD